ncbi:class I SAM-dependent methyltransferase [Halobacillus sp. A5]|uniref:class I SAM-dependent methyltransferase n=1 Tax=Halobacillus sp. A5 TaxID=2880263 RepID=UPI0020A64D01|nr:class I SAM-dependent methyltransferase [Halobacillus sp. A5]MCP3029365.1 class I SAM-dependent methyltransferase [Halobacillus sp. A5]
MNDENIKRQVQKTFSKSKESYVTSKTHNNRKDLDMITVWLQPKSSWTVLDIATGGGHVARQLSLDAELVFATDLTKEMLANTASHLHSYSNIHYVVADAEQLPFIDESFDAVTCRIAPHHFPNPGHFIHEVHRVLKKDGRFVMIDNIAPEDTELDSFYNSFEKMRDSSHHRAWKVSEWKKLLKEYGLRIEKEIDRKKTLPFYEWASRTLEEKEIHQVETYFLNSSTRLKSYFQIKTHSERVTEFTIDEWMVLSSKPL